MTSSYTPPPCDHLCVNCNCTPEQRAKGEYEFLRGYMTICMHYIKDIQRSLLLSPVLNPQKIECLQGELNKEKQGLAKTIEKMDQIQVYLNTHSSR